MEVIVKTSISNTGKIDCFILNPSIYELDKKRVQISDRNIKFSKWESVTHKNTYEVKKIKENKDGETLLFTDGTEGLIDDYISEKPELLDNWYYIGVIDNYYKVIDESEFNYDNSGILFKLNKKLSISNSNILFLYNKDVGVIEKEDALEAQFSHFYVRLLYPLDKDEANELDTYLFEKSKYSSKIKSILDYYDISSSKEIYHQYVKIDKNSMDNHKVKVVLGEDLF